MDIRAKNRSCQMFKYLYRRTIGTLPEAAAEKPLWYSRSCCQQEESMDKELEQTTSSPASRVLVVCSRTPGPDDVAGDRCWQLAESLASAHDVILALPQVSELFHEDFTVVYYNSLNVGLVARDSDVVVCDAGVLESNARLVDAGKPVAVDLAGADSSTAVLAPADFFICQTEDERSGWLAYLEDSGRVNPHTLDGDNDLRSLIDVVRLGEYAAPLLDYCAAPRFARDRGTRFSSAILPVVPPRPGSIGHYRRRFRYLMRYGGFRAVCSRAMAVIKRKIRGI